MFDKEREVEHKCIVKLTTSVWGDKDGFYIKKSLKFLKRKCVGYNVLQEETNVMGAEEVYQRILNINDVEDGIYSVVVVNESRDWETNNVEDWDYELYPYKE